MSGLLQELARERFVPEEFDSIFKSRKGGPPPWIDQLAADPAGRQLYYQLTSGHRNCLLLNYAVQKILNAGKGRCWPDAVMLCLLLT